jgi:hypothetical protein
VGDVNDQRPFPSGMGSIPGSDENPQKYQKKMNF